MTDSKKLTPPDRKRCQSTYKLGPFTMGGTIGKWIRCSNIPVVIIREREAGQDGMLGSMSLCAECFKVAKKQLLPFEFETCVIHTAHERAEKTEGEK